MLFQHYKADVMLACTDGFSFLSKHSDYIINTGNLPSLFLSITSWNSSSLNTLQSKPHWRTHWISSRLNRTCWRYKQSCCCMQEIDIQISNSGAAEKMWKIGIFCTGVLHIHIRRHFLDIYCMENHRRKIYSQTAARWISSVKTKDECQISRGENYLHQLLYSSRALAEIKRSSTRTYTAKVSSLISWFITRHPQIKDISLFWCFKEVSLIDYPLAFRGIQPPLASNADNAFQAFHLYAISLS